MLDTGFADTKHALESFIQENFEGSPSGVPVRYENVRFSIPSNGVFASVHVRQGTGRRLSLGAQASWRFPGVLIVQLFQPKDTGSTTVEGLADLLGNLLHEEVISLGDSGSIHLGTPSSIHVGETSTLNTAASYYQLNLQVPFYTDVYN